MSRASLSTPCPAPSFATDRLSLHHHHRRISTLPSSTADDTCTANIDYTRANVVQQEFSNARPRRKSHFVGGTRGPRKEEISIFEDLVEEEQREGKWVVAEPQQPKVLGGRTLLGKPAQRMPMARRKRVAADEGEAGKGSAVKVVRKRESILPDALVYETATEARPVPVKSVYSAPGEAWRKDPRRKTIFVPDDTTVLTIHPGANTTCQINDTFQLPELPSRNHGDADARPVEVNTVKEMRPIVRRPRASLAAAPKRIPLGSLTMSRDNIPATDVNGQSGGKENRAPFALEDQVSNIDGLSDMKLPNGYSKSLSSAQSRPGQSTAKMQARQTAQIHRADPLLQPHVLSQGSLRGQSDGFVSPQQRAARTTTGLPTSRLSVLPRPNAIGPSTMRDTPLSRPNTTSQGDRPSPALSSFIASQRATMRLSQYPLLNHDVAQPQLYEESWLSQQDIALTELTNEVFKSVESRKRQGDQQQTSLREALLPIYHQAHVVTMHQRLQASLLYGALARPKDLPNDGSLTNDLGLRKRFLKIWLDTYDEQALRSCAEIVIGRQATPGSESRPTVLLSTESVIDPIKDRRALIGFLETFLLLAEDVDRGAESCSSVDDLLSARRRKTVLRSLMLVWLLDQAKASGQFQGCLFRKSSGLKSSTAVLNSLSSLLLQSVGDITRALRHFDYSVSHVQHPLDEVDYRIQNVAVDLRDGVMLTRLVEILAFSQSFDGSSNGNETITINLPDDITIDQNFFAPDGRPKSRPLSQHLKLPCPSRAQKLYNVSIALSALATRSDVTEGVLSNVKAADVVDGHREKTLALLWSLLSHHGLKTLIDWEEMITVCREAPTKPPPASLRYDTPEDREYILLTWVTALSARTGLQITNLTTSFADKRAYTCILDTYSDSLPHQSSPTLQSRLKALDCSTAFAQHLSTTTPSIPSRTTTLATLAFLASRILPLARQRSAATLIQRALRKRRAHRVVSQRITLMRLAHACATVVQTRNRVADAAVVLQRAWRGVLEKRVQKLNGDVGAFQSVAKGWLVRRAVLRESGRREMRVMGGW